MSQTDTMLIIEDSKPIASLIKHIAEQAGYQTDLAMSYAQAEALLASGKSYSVASIDYNLPDAPEGEAIDLVLDTKTPGIVLTGKMDEATRDKILRKPVVDYIPKETAQAYAYLGKLLTRLKLNRYIKVLVVDDSKAARLYLSHLLSRHQFQVSVAENGQAGLDYLVENPDVKLVITDNEMPVMGGIKFVSEARKLYTKDQISIIGLSGNDAGSLSARFIKSGANDFLKKPFCHEEFYCRVVQNIEHLEYVNRIQMLANTDYLTKLGNRRYFFDKAPEAIKRCISQQQSYGLAMIDIDHFKKINDVYGHDAGDVVISHIADVMRKIFPSAIVARFGGEEFCILFEDASIESVLSELDTLRREIEASEITFNQDNIRYTISIGYSEQSENIDLMLSVADNALYQSKTNGRNQVTAQKPELETN